MELACKHTNMRTRNKEITVYVMRVTIYLNGCTPVDHTHLDLKHQTWLVLITGGIVHRHAPRECCRHEAQLNTTTYIHVIWRPKFRRQYPTFGATVYPESLHCLGEFDDCRVEHMECCGEWGRPAFLLPCPDVTGRPFRQ